MMQSASSLFEPSLESKSFSTLLHKQILNLIQKDGFISFARFMEQALYAPKIGYYCNPFPKFGFEGDFITAPEASSLFSKTLAQQCKEILISLGEGSILELGAGSGRMAADILLELERTKTLPEHYYILEVSPTLKTIQQKNLFLKCPHLYERIVWLDPALGSSPEENQLAIQQGQLKGIPKIPPKFPFNGIILANELFDALPVHRFQITKNGVEEKVVCQENGQLTWGVQYNSKLTMPEYEFLNLLDIGYVSEIHLCLKDKIKTYANFLNKGVMLFIDYGFPRKEYYHPDRNQGTLMCHYHHRTNQNPFWYPGLQDITAHVDFTAIAEAGTDNALEVLGFAHQAGFLLGAGLLDFDHSLSQKQAIHMLTSPAEMGELFKVIALGKDYSGKRLSGFSLINHVHKL